MASIGVLVKSGFYLYLSTLVASIVGYVYWLLVSRLAGPDVLGVSSAIAGVATLVVNVLSLGVPVALQRGLGECLGRGDEECFSRLYWSVMLFHLILYGLAALALVTLAFGGLSIQGYTRGMLVAAALTILVSGLGQAPAAALTARLETWRLLVATVSGSIVKLVVGLGLVLLGLGWAGVVAGNLSYSIVALAVAVAGVLHATRPRLVLEPRVVVEMVRVGVPVWLPGFIQTAGMWLGVLAVYSYGSALETGRYYAAQAIASILANTPTIVLGPLLPVLAATRQGREQLASDATRLALALVTPLAVFASFYPEAVLSLLGPGYTGAALVLALLAASSIPGVVAGVVSGLAYVKGEYRLVLFTGLASSLPRIALYPLLVQAYGATGAAVASTAGALAGLAAAAYVSRVVGYRHDSRVYIKILGTPLALALLSQPLPRQYWPLALAIILASYPVYARLKVVTRRDLREIARAYLAPETIQKMQERFRPILSALLPPD